ncbi:homeotic protein antennapedia isoform X1 [Ooceraea biroi]|uniref:homeotic protein antennapedia isoform X1 n=1 Tax=Ooceraea biroi TaxID=2015173 RepID=UPI0005B89688|nr:homeotic protein antennapedia isoform X1 [Ooceraea biroi]
MCSVPLIYDSNSASAVPNVMSESNNYMMPFYEGIDLYREQQQIIGSQQQQQLAQQQQPQAGSMQQVHSHPAGVNGNQQYWYGYASRSAPSIGLLHQTQVASQQFFNPSNVLASWTRPYSSHYSQLPCQQTYQSHIPQSQSQSYIQHPALTQQQFQQYSSTKQHLARQPQQSSKHVHLRQNRQPQQNSSSEQHLPQNPSPKQQLQHSPLEQQEYSSTHHLQQLPSPNQHLQYPSPQQLSQQLSPQQQLQYSPPQEHLPQESSPQQHFQQTSPSLQQHVQLEPSQKQHMQQDMMQWMNAESAGIEIGNQHSAPAITTNMNSNISGSMSSSVNESIENTNGSANESVTGSINGSVNSSVHSQHNSPSTTTHEDFNLSSTCGNTDLTYSGKLSQSVSYDYDNLLLGLLAGFSLELLGKNMSTTGLTDISTPAPDNQDLSSSPRTSMKDKPTYTPRNLHRRSPYEWMKRPSYQSQPNPGKTRTKDKYRVVYSDYQRLELEKEFLSSNRYITIKRKAEIAELLQLTERQVKIWFQNRRAKERKILKRREEQITRHQTTPLEGRAEAATSFPGVPGGMGGMLGGLIHTNDSTSSSMQLAAPLVPSSHLHQALCRSSTNTSHLSIRNACPTFAPPELIPSTVS